MSPAAAPPRPDLTLFPYTTLFRSSDNAGFTLKDTLTAGTSFVSASGACTNSSGTVSCVSGGLTNGSSVTWTIRSEEQTSELQSPMQLVSRPLLEEKNQTTDTETSYN